ncbi:MAG: transglutaminase domain-containing protein [Lachnospiraceae bacterium]|nr:transglutaminase domain-containing protein [Lachnospiraceae bacterium]
MKKLMLICALCFFLGLGYKPIAAAAAPASTDEWEEGEENVYSATPHPKTRPKKAKAAVKIPAKAPSYVAEELNPVSRETFPEAAAALDSVGWDLRAAYMWSVTQLSYYGHGKPDMPEEGSPGTRWFADFGFSRHCGNCFVFAATFYEMARLLGYPGRQIYGQVPSINGGLTPHSWVELDIDGDTWVFDPECEHATKKNCFMFKYGTGGTWRYSNYAPMEE